MLVVKNDFSESDLNKARVAGCDISPVRASDLCVYLTDDRNGGIDSVFNES